MITVQGLIELAKAKGGIPSNYRLARVLGVSDQTVGNWKAGRKSPDDAMASRLAEMAGLDAGLVMASMHAERADSAPVRDLWADVANRLARASAAAAVACIAVTGSPDALAHAPGGAPGQTARIYLM